MKRFLALLLTLCLTLSMISVVGAVEAGECALTGAQVSPEGDEVQITLTSGVEGTLYLAVYDLSGRMAGVTAQAVSAAAGEQTVAVPMPENVSEYWDIKVFLLDSHTGAPLCEGVRVSAAQRVIDMLEIPETWKEELQVGDAMGLPMAALEQESISGAEMTALLDVLVKYAAPEKLEQWKQAYPALRESGEPLTRFDAMAALFLAADTVGGGYAGVRFDPYAFANSLDHNWDEDYLNWTLYGGWRPELVFDIGMGGGEGYLDASSYYYNLGRKSQISGEYPFAYDAGSNSVRVKENATYLEAVLAVVRLMNSNADVRETLLKASEFYYLEEEAALAVYYEGAQKRKTEILNTQTEIERSDIFIPGETYTGTAYYISPDGDDANDGLTPETAWKTPVPANGGMGNVQEGDAVFFERGGVYRLTEMALTLTTNVTYSAYGEGDKPVITLAQENSARTECWELWYEGAQGEKIWRYYKPLGEVGGIVFDDTAYAKRVLEWPTPEGWLALEVREMDPANGLCAADDPCALWELVSAEEYRTVTEQLKNDMTYLCRVDIAGLTYPVDFGRQYREGELYLRCDVGNPGEQFGDIEVIALPQNANGDTYGLLDGYHAGGFVLDNLSLKYYLDNAVNNDPTLPGGVVIQNCTLEWGGNRLHRVESEVPTNNFFLIGDCIYNVMTDATIRNNYMRQGGNGSTFESSVELPENLGTYTVSGNLIENCGQGIRTYLIFEEDASRFDALVIQDNMILHTGDSMNNACLEEPAAIDLGGTDVQFADRIEVSGNVLIGSTMAMLRVSNPARVELDIHDNVIAQSREGVLMTEFTWTDSGLTWHMMEDIR